MRAVHVHVNVNTPPCGHYDDDAPHLLFPLVPLCDPAISNVFRARITIGMTFSFFFLRE